MDLSSEEQAPVELLLLELRRLLDGIVLTQEVSPRLRARVAAFGELLSSQLGLAYLRKAGINACRVDPRSLLTSEPDAALSEADTYLEADVRPTVQVARANEAARGCPVVICGGFIASTAAGATCLLGRGGSDTSAALFASFVGAQRLEIWTDVNGQERHRKLLARAFSAFYCTPPVPLVHSF
jgi:bifunctional diaminopimelate decarboxylase / aspartate kinase